MKTVQMELKIGDALIRKIRDTARLTSGEWFGYYRGERVAVFLPNGKNDPPVQRAIDWMEAVNQ